MKIIPLNDIDFKLDIPITLFQCHSLDITEVVFHFKPL